MESKTGIKTVDKLSEIPVLNSAVTTASDYYGKVKEANSLIRTSCNLAELSLKTFKYAASPITYLCKKPSKIELMKLKIKFYLFNRYLCYNQLNQLILI